MIIIASKDSSTHLIETFGDSYILLLTKHKSDEQSLSFFLMQFCSFNFELEILYIITALLLKNVLFSKLSVL